MDITIVIPVILGVAFIMGVAFLFIINYRDEKKNERREKEER